MGQTDDASDGRGARTERKGRLVECTATSRHAVKFCPLPVVLVFARNDKLSVVLCVSCAATGTADLRPCARS